MGECSERFLNFHKRNDQAGLLALCETGPCSSCVECLRYLGWKSYEEKKFDQALILFSDAARNSDAEAEFGIASVHWAVKEFAKAKNHLTIAAELGYTRAFHWLGSLYHMGLGVPKDIPKAIFFYTKSAEAGHLMGERRLIQVDNERGSVARRIWGLCRIFKLALKAGAIAKKNGDDPRIVDVPNALKKYTG